MSLARSPGRHRVQVVHAVVADRDAEVLRRDVLELVRLVHDRIAAMRDDLAVRVLPHRGVGAQQVVVDDDDVGFRGALAHSRDVAVVELRAVDPDAVLGAGGDLLPEGQVLRQVLDLRAVACLGLAAPRVDDPDVRRLLARSDRGTVPEGLEAVQAEIVAAPLHVGRPERDAQRVAQDRQVLEVDLLLEVLGSGRDEHALPAEDGRDEVREGLAGAGAGLGQQHAAIGDDRRDGVAISSWPGRASKPGSARAIGPSGSNARATADRERYGSGYSGNFRHRASTSCRTPASAESSGWSGEGAGDEFADRVHLGLAHAPAGDGGRADADAAGDHRRVPVERDRVLVDGDARLGRARPRRPCR
jgi:hypothetical protein